MYAESRNPLATPAPLDERAAAPALAGDAGLNFYGTNAGLIFKAPTPHQGSDSSGTDSEGENNGANGAAEPGRESGDDIEAFRLRQRWLDGAGLQPGASAEDVAQAQLAYIERLEKENARFVVQN